MTWGCIYFYFRFVDEETFVVREAKRFAQEDTVRKRLAFELSTNSKELFLTTLSVSHMVRTLLFPETSVHNHQEQWFNTIL